jgi:predicted dehydrogenase
VACRFGETYAVPVASDWSEFLAAVDAIIVATPSGLHAKIGIEAARAGKHVLVEKPIDVGLEAATRLVETCEEQGVTLGCISQHRFASSIQELRDSIARGDFGKLLIGDAAIKWNRTQEYYDSGDWRGTYALDGGGCLMNQGVHYVDMIQWLMGGVRSVRAICRTINHAIEVEDVAMAIVEYRNGAIGSIRATTCCYPELAERLEVHGTFGSAILERDRIKLWHVDPESATKGQYGGGVMMQPAPAAKIADVFEEDVTMQWGEQHRLQIADFVEAIQSHRAPAITGRDALEPLKIILAIYESSRRGCVEVEIT